MGVGKVLGRAVKEVLLLPVAPIRYPYKLLKLGAKGAKKAYDWNKDRVSDNSLEDLMLIGMDYDGDEIAVLEEAILNKEAEIERTKERINKHNQDEESLDKKIAEGEAALEKMKSKKNIVGAVTVKAGRKYRVQKELVESYKRTKKDYPNKLKNERANLKAQEIELKDTKKRLKELKSKLRKEARDHEEVIKVVKYFYKNIDKFIERCDPEVVESIESEMQEIRDNKGNWPFVATPQQYLKSLKESIKIRGRQEVEEESMQQPMQHQQPQIQNRPAERAPKAQTTARTKVEIDKDWQDFFRDEGTFSPDAFKETEKAEEPKAEEPKAEEPKAEEPKAEEPKAEEPKAEEPKAEEPKAEEPKAEEPKVEEPKAEEPKAEEPKAEKPKAEEPKAEEPKAEEPKVEEPKVEVTKHYDKKVIRKLNDYMEEEILDEGDITGLNSEQEYEGTIDDIIAEVKGDKKLPTLEEQLAAAKEKFEKRDKQQSSKGGKHLTPEEKAKEAKREEQNARRREKRAEAKRIKQVNIQSLLENRAQLIEAIESERTPSIRSEFMKELRNIEGRLEGYGEKVEPYVENTSTIIDRRSEFLKQLKVEDTPNGKKGVGNFDTDMPQKADDKTQSTDDDGR